MISPDQWARKANETEGEQILRIGMVMLARERALATMASKANDEGIIEVYKRGRADGVFELVALLSSILPGFKGSFGETTAN